MLKKTIMLVCFFTMSNSWGTGNLFVMPITTEIAYPKEKSITVKNTGDSPLYIDLSLYKVENPGNNPEKKHLVTELKAPKIIASPTKVSLGAGQSRKIKLVTLAPVSQEEVYRLYVIPVSSITTKDNGLSDKISTPTVLSIGYGVLIRILPEKNLHSEIEYTCSTEGITLKNTGNIRAELDNVILDDKLRKNKMSIYPLSPITLNYKKMTAKYKDKDYSINCNIKK